MTTFKSIILTVLLWQASSAYEIQMQNQCGFPIFAKSEGGNSQSGYLNPGDALTANDVTRVWALTGCDGDGNNCDTQEGVVSLAEMYWDGDGKTWYDVSQVDGYNLPIAMEPYQNTGGRCENVRCNYNLDDCPGDLKIYRDDRVVACKTRNRDAITDYSDSIKAACPNVYSWSQDNEAGMRDCMPGNGGLRVIFC